VRPVVEVKETKEEDLVITAEMPGVNKDNVRVEVRVCNVV
jgi:HSP20 family molecular chaperone IbpA